MILAVSSAFRELPCLTALLTLARGGNEERRLLGPWVIHCQSIAANKPHASPLSKKIKAKQWKENCAIIYAASIGDN